MREWKKLYGRPLVFGKPVFDGLLNREGLEASFARILVGRRDYSEVQEDSVGNICIEVPPCKSRFYRLGSRPL